MRRPPAPGTVELWTSAPARAGASSDQPRSVLNASDADHRAGRRLLRLVLASYTGGAPETLAFDRTCRHCARPHGKPVLRGSGLDFSLSHADGRAVLAVSSGADVGVDVEPAARRAEALRAALSPAELAAAALGDDGELLRHWTRKEALLKASGHGLAVEPSRVTLRAAGPGRWRVAEAEHLADPPRWAVADLELSDGLVGAVALHGTLDRVVLLRCAA